MLLKSFACLIMVVIECQGHGRLYDPPSRASAWRFGFNTPIDYQDNEGFCGGFSHQYYSQDGKCGICGDPWEKLPRPHEVGGLYATGTIVRHYQEGQVMNVTVDITANHLGHFEARICPDPEIDATQECLDMHRLNMADGSGNVFNISSDVGLYNMLVQLPTGLTCDHCVFQWRYVSGNNWGVCEDGTGALGCGPQEEFRACADVSISSAKSFRTRQNLGVSMEEGPTTTDHLNSNDVKEVSPPLSPKVLPSKPLTCKGVGVWATLPGAAKWCTINCNNFPTFCPKSNCKCK